MREAENIREVEALGIDLMGFIFWPKSSRYMSERPAYLPEKAKRVGVFVDETIEKVKDIAKTYQLDLIQLHGKESPNYAEKLSDYRLIKAFNIASADDFAACAAYEGKVDFFLFDTKGKSVGGNGEKFDWSVLTAYDSDTSFLLSGGIGPHDAEHLKAFQYPKCIGIDLNSRFEIAPGLKDINKLKDFIKELSI